MNPYPPSPPFPATAPRTASRSPRNTCSDRRANSSPSSTARELGSTPTSSSTVRLLATYDPNGLHFPITDALGTKRVQASGTGQAELACANLPFGDGEPCANLGAGTEATEHRFTGKERDSESGLDYFFGE